MVKGGYFQIWYVPGFLVSLDSIRALKFPMDILLSRVFFFSFLLPFLCPKYYACRRYLKQETVVTHGFQQSSQRQSCSAVSGFGLESNKDDAIVLPGKSSKPKQLFQSFLICSFVQTLPGRECWLPDSHRPRERVVGGR